MSGRVKQSAAGHFLLIAAAFVIVVAGMRAAESLIVPLLLSAFIAVIAASPLFYLQKRGLPNWLALMVVIAGVVGIGALLVLLVGGSFKAFQANLPFYQERLGQQATAILILLRGYGIDISEETLHTFFDPKKMMAVVGQTLSGLGGVLTNAFLILLTVIFILLEAAGFPAKLHRMMDEAELSLRHFDTIMLNIKRYMVIKSSTSLFTGVVITLWLTFLGIDYPLLWGTLAFLLNFVPNIGSIIAAVPVLLLALIQLGSGAALWTGLGYLVVNNVVGNVIEPRFMGRGLGLSALVVFISLVFWGWVLGPVGMFLSVPLTMTLKIAMDANESTRPIAILLGPEIKTAE
ncbi:MAG: AI-2E family transporter [Candidatus Polarisedimenticolaceae bacterium]|nr:AI-2E family transporter [Candidatus Polarisedimenticolaceae bacterium]